MEVTVASAESDSSAAAAAAAADGSNGTVVNEKKMSNRIQVSNTKKPLFFYVNLAKRYMRQHSEVELSALGMAIGTVVTIAEILKNNGLAVEKKIMTSTIDMKDDTKGRLVQKAKIEILLGKTENFDTLMAAAAAASSTVSDVAPAPASVTTTISDVVSAATSTVSKVVSAATATISEVVAAGTATESEVATDDKKEDAKV